MYGCIPSDWKALLTIAIGADAVVHDFPTLSVDFLRIDVPLAAVEVPLAGLPLGVLSFSFEDLLACLVLFPEAVFEGCFPSDSEWNP